MRLLAFSLIAGLLVLETCSEAASFGRGGGVAPPHGGGAPPHGGGAPPHVGGVAPPHVGGAWHGAASGPFGGVHSVTPIPPRVEGIPRGVVVPHGEVHPGVIAGHPGVEGRPGEVGGGLGARSGVGGGYARLGHYTTHLRPSSLSGIGREIRGREYPYFTRDWYRNHGGAWFPGIWAGGVNPWFFAPWGTLAPFVGIGGPPIDYDYGSTAVIQDGSMYLNGDAVGSAEDYASQAIALDDLGRGATLGASDEWQPIGVFGLIQGNETTAQRIFQLAVNKAGIVHGNYYDALADANQPVFGAIDPKTQRVAWSIGDRKDIVYEAGLNNLLQNEATVLIHYGNTRTQQMILVRLAEPPALPPPSNPSAQPTIPPAPPMK